MRLKSRPVSLKKAAPCRLCGRAAAEGFSLRGPSEGFVCPRCHQDFYAPLIEANRFRLRDLLTADVWAPLIVRDDETVMPYLTAARIRQADKVIRYLFAALFVALLVIIRPAFSDITAVPGRAVSALSMLGEVLPRLAAPVPRLEIISGRFLLLLARLIEGILTLPDLLPGGSV